MGQYSFYRPESRPFQLTIQGEINNCGLQILGCGVVERHGIYRATLNFSDMPDGLHPSAISTFLISICCNLVSAMRNSGLNIEAMGATGYQTQRILTFGEHGEIVINGDVEGKDSITTFDASISGEADLPNDLNGTSIYTKRIEPRDDGARLVCVGNGALFRHGAAAIEVGVESEHRLRPLPVANPLTFLQFRTSSECGRLVGRTYETTVQAVVDSNDSFADAARSPLRRFV